MSSNREQFFNCYRPILFPMFATGCLSFRLNRKAQCEVNTFTKVYTYVVRVAIFGVFIAGLVLKFKSNAFSKRTRSLSPLIQLIVIADVFFSMTTYTTFVLQWEYRKHEHIQLYERALELDTILAKAFAVNFNYHKTIRKNNIFIGLVSFYCTVYYPTYILMLDTDWRMAMMGIGYTLCTLGPGACSFGHMSFMDYLRVRFRLLQKMFAKRLQLSEKQEAGERRNTFLLINCYRNYCEFTKDINKTYGLVAIISYFHDFAQLSSMVFVLCHKASESRPIVSEYIALFMFVLPRMIKILYTAIYSRLAVMESVTCMHTITKYDFKYPSKEVKEQIDCLLWWKGHQNFDFKIGRALRSNFGLVFSILHGIANYILILMQLKTQESSIEDRFNLKKNVYTGAPFEK